MKLGKLEKIDLREQWKNEASDFTPWLAKEENIESLGDVLQMDLEVVNSEENVGPYRADILCKDVSTNNYVVIENQLEKTDHSHLGQILTYSAGLDSSTMIWIAEKFTDEHRAALDRLNEITSEDINFFGIEMELWKIGNSDPAPKFNIVSKPNNWSKNVKRIAENSEVSENGEFRLEYWTKLNEYFQSKGKQVFKTGYKPSTNHWMIFSIGKRGIHTCVDVIRKDGGFIRVNLVFTDEKAKYNFDKIKELYEEDSKILGEINWHRLDDAKSSVVCIKKQFDVMDKAKWEEQHDWIRENLEKFHNYFGPKIKNLT